MTKFEDQLYQQLLTEHGHHLHGAPQPAPARRHRAGRPVWLATGAAGVAGANTTLHAIGARVRVVPVGPHCPSIGSLPHPQPAPRASVQVRTGIDANGHRSVSVKVGNAGIPAGDTLILAFSGDQSTGSVGAGGVITGQVPSCVSLPAPPA